MTLARARGRVPSTVPGGAPSIAVVALVIALGGSAVPAAASTGAVSPRNAHASSSRVPSSAYAIVKAIPVGASPWAVAVNDADDTVYVTNAGSNSVSVIDGRTSQVTSTIGVGLAPWGVAVNQTTGTIYVANTNSNSVSIIDGRTQTVTSTIGVGASPQGAAVYDATGAVFVANSGSNSVSVIDGRSGTVTSTIGVVGTPFGVTVNQKTGMVYVVGQGARSSGASGITAPGFMSTINARTGALVSESAFGVSPWSVAVHEADDKVYVTDTWLSTLSAFTGADVGTWSSVKGNYLPWNVAVNQATGSAFVSNNGQASTAAPVGLVSIFGGTSLGSSIALGHAIGQAPSVSRGVAIDQAGLNTGLAYVAALDANAVDVVARVTPGSAPGSGAEGDTVQISLSVPHLSPAVALDDTTVASVRFGGIPATSLAPGPGNTWKVTAPQGKGSVPIVVYFNGGQRAQAGTFMYRS